MDNSFQTSFIPQQPLLKVEGFQRRKEAMNFALVISLVIFFVTISLAGAIYFWRTSIEKRLAAHAAELSEAEQRLDTSVVTKFRKVDERLVQGKLLLANHMAFSVVLDFLEQTTASNIGFTSLAFNEDPKEMSITLIGDAPSYESIYFQAESWRKVVPLVKLAEVTKVSLAENIGVVNFEARIVLDQSLLKYKKALEARERTASTTAVVEVNPPTP